MYTLQYGILLNENEQTAAIFKRTNIMLSERGIN